ncbi:MAG: sensor histidine kinase [Actinobacteria bacterium]|nr:MAG: sensor histidine kinase [Actinomycetota bacterium]
MCAAGSIAAAIWAVQFQRASDRPVGEGELFVDEARSVVDRLVAMPMGRDGLGDTVRHLRNDLAIEAVAVVGPDGVIDASSAPAMEGRALESSLLARALDGGTFAAEATPLPFPVTIDGVEEWVAGDVLYQVIQPIAATNGAVLLLYDVSELLERRGRAAGIQPETVQALAAAAILGGLAMLMVLGRSLAGRRFREYEIEAGFLRTQAAQLEEHNRELELARQQAERALSLAEEKNRIRSEFVMMINHELRTPLTSLVSGAQLLQSDELPDSIASSIVADMIEDGRRLEEMIRQILDVARIENRGLWYELHDVAAIALYDQIERELPRTPVTVAEEVLALGPMVHTDPQTVAALLRSLAENARSHGARNVAVTVSDRPESLPMLEVGTRPQHALYLTVADDGPGIRPDFLPRAFEKFEKDSFSSGTGLGLYVAKLMVEAIEGSLTVSTSEAGTRMTLAIPVVTEATDGEVAA